HWRSRYNRQSMSSRGLRVGLALAFVVAACAEENPVLPQLGSRAARLVQEGDARLAQSDFAGALEAYQQALEEDSEYALAYSHRAYALLFEPAEQGQAVEEARQATELQPESGEAWAYLARALDWNGDFDEALDAAQRAERLNSDSANVQSFLAEVLADLRMYDEALKAGEEAVRLDPKNAEAHRNLAYIYGFMGRPEDALDEYQEAYALEPEFVHRNTSLAAHYLFDADDDDMAAEWLAKAEAIAPDDYITLLFLARLHSGRGGYDEAIEYCERILEHAPNAPDGYNCLGGVFLDAGLYEDALRARQTAIRADPGEDSGYIGLGYTYYSHGECDRAAAQFERAVEIHPRSGSNHAALGFAYVCLRMWNEAEMEYETAIELEPYQGGHHILLGRMHLEQGNLREAEQEFEAGLDLDPDDDQYVAWLARLYAEEGDLDRSIAQYERAAEMDTKDGSHELAIGFAYLNAGTNYEQAAARFVRALEIYIEYGATAREMARASFGLALTHLGAGDCPAAIPHLQEAIRLDSAMIAAREYLAQCRLVSGFEGAAMPPEILQRGLHAGLPALETLVQGLAVMGIDAKAEFRAGENGEFLMFVGHIGIGQPGTRELLSQQSLVTFASSLVAARTVVPEISRVVVVTLDNTGETVGVLEVLVQDARLWDLGILTDAGFTSQWRPLQP
ncbi:MAG: tetratricopeptide repeat protein, partial [Anaerolineales bacterium]